jgi:putative ABC transport system permease protein
VTGLSRKLRVGLDPLLHDVRYGLRMLRKSPGFTLVATLALALGIGANTAIYTLVYAILLAPLPYPHPDQLVMVWSKIQGNPNRRMASVGDYWDWKRHSSAFQDLTAWVGRTARLSLAERPEQVSVTLSAPGLSTMVGNRFFLGRDFLPEEGQPGKERVAIVTHRFWRERLGSDRNVLGRDLRIDGGLYSIVGVLAPGVADRAEGGIWLPLVLPENDVGRDHDRLLVMGRLKPGIPLARARADMEVVARRIAEAHPDTNKGWTASVEPLKNDFLSKDTVRALWLLLGAVGFVLLIACANVANLLLARGAARRREVAVRSALGAGRGRLVRQFLAESVVLAAIGGGMGIALSSVLLQVIVALMPAGMLPIEADIGLNLPVLLFTLAVSFVSGVLFGSAPAWQATRTDPNAGLREEGRSLYGGSRNRLRRGLAVVEFALALTLLAGGGMALHGLVKLMRVDFGFRTDHLLTFELPVPQERLQGTAKTNAFYRELLEKMRSLPGVLSVSASTGIPSQSTWFGLDFEIVGHPVADPRRRPDAGFRMVTPSYFKNLGIEIKAGRRLTEEDREGGPRVALVNEALAKKFLPGLNPLEQRLLIPEIVAGAPGPGPPVEWRIVGVYRDVRNDGPVVEGFPEIDVPFWQCPWPSAMMAVRTTGEPQRLTPSLAGVIQSMDPDLPMAKVKTMDQIVSDSLADARFATLLLGGFACLALLLAAVGIYGLMSFAVAQRTHEIGLRMALGAGRGQVLRQVLREGMSTAFLGAAIGALGAYLVGHLLHGFWYDIGAMDVPAFAAVTALLLAFALLACLVPARRAASVQPMVALRQE